MIDSILLLIVFGSISVIHFYWAFGGQLGLTNSIPSKPDGSLLFVPGFWSCLIVAVLFLLGVVVELMTFWEGVLNVPFSYVYWVIPGVFFLRSIGDFRYVGFFKTVRETDFGRADTLYYSPLCLAISMLAVVQAIRIT